MKRTTTHDEKLSAATRAAAEYVKARNAIVPAVIAWLRHHGYDAVRHAPAIDRPLVRAILAHLKARDTLHRALDGELVRPPRPARRRSS